MSKAVITRKPFIIKEASWPSVGYTNQNECLNMAAVADIDGISVPFLHINQLIANKKAVDRPKDQIDVIELEKIQKILGES